MVVKLLNLESSMILGKIMQECTGMVNFLAFLSFFSVCCGA